MSVQGKLRNREPEKKSRFLYSSYGRITETLVVFVSGGLGSASSPHAAPGSPAPRRWAQFSQGDGAWKEGLELGLEQDSCPPNTRAPMKSPITELTPTESHFPPERRVPFTFVIFSFHVL